MYDRAYTWREKLFYAAAWTPKATVQASLSAVPLTMITAKYSGQPDFAEWELWGQEILTAGVFAIIVCGTLGTLAVFALAPVLLHKGEVRCAHARCVHLHRTVRLNSSACSASRVLRARGAPDPATTRVRPQGLAHARSSQGLASGKQPPGGRGSGALQRRSRDTSAPPLLSAPAASDGSHGRCAHARRPALPAARRATLPPPAPPTRPPAARAPPAPRPHAPSPPPPRNPHPRATNQPAPERGRPPRRVRPLPHRGVL